MREKVVEKAVSRMFMLLSFPFLYLSDIFYEITLCSHAVARSTAKNWRIEQVHQFSWVNAISWFELIE